MFGIKQINGRLLEPTVDWMIGSEVSSGATASVAATSVRRTETAGAVAHTLSAGTLADSVEAPCHSCHEVACEGVDTACKVVLGERLIGNRFALME